MGKWIVILSLLLTILSSCGGGGGAEAGCDDLSNSCVYVSLEPKTTDADVANWDVNGDGICDEQPAFQSYYMDVRIRVEPINPDFQTQEVELRDYEVNFKPITQETPALNPKFITVSSSIKPNQEKTVSLEILNQDDAKNLYNWGAYREVFQYFVIIKFHFVEIPSGEETYITRYGYIKVSDFADNCKEGG